ncbi:MAG: PH domain-containing protein [Patescibacteria group bacterium]|nr:PH domain-containing protein [Patescibacteria group bacterium]
MEIYNQRREEQKHELEPIRGSIVILTARLATALVLFEALHVIAYYILNLGIPLPFGLHRQVAQVLLVLDILKLFAELYFIVNITLSWVNNTYYLTDKHLIQRRGIFRAEEDVFHFDNIRSISISQSIIGKILNYGDIILKTSASGGYQGDVVMSGVANPKKYEDIISKYF